MNSPYPEPRFYAEFARLQRSRYPDRDWSQCECWMESDWLHYAPQLPWTLARFHVLAAWQESERAH